MNKIKLALISILASSALYAGTYKVDSSHSQVEFKVKHMMISNVSGKFEKFEGSYEYDEKTKTLKSLNGVVEVSSVDTDNVKRDEHLKSEEFFDSVKYPKITFNLLKVKDEKVYGELSIKGITKEVILDVETSDVIKDPWGNNRTAIVLTGKINRTDYGLKYNTVLETGGVAVSEEVKLSVEIEGILNK